MAVAGADQIDDRGDARYLPGNIKPDPGQPGLGLKQSPHCVYSLWNDQRVMRQLPHWQWRQSGALALRLCGRMTDQPERLLKQRRDLESGLRIGIINQTDVDAARRDPLDDVGR